jgi:hypothetical protein
MEKKQSKKITEIILCTYVASTEPQVSRRIVLSLHPDLYISLETKAFRVFSLSNLFFDCLEILSSLVRLIGYKL